MKFLTLLTVLSLHPAFANDYTYECSNAAGERLWIYHSGGAEANVILKGPDANLVLKGTYTYEDEPLYEVTEYDLTTAQDEKASLTVTKKVFIGRGGCGRAGCPDSPLKTKKAVFKLNEVAKFFSCL